MGTFSPPWRQIEEADLYQAAHERIGRARAIVETSMQKGCIPKPPREETIIYGG